VVGVDPDRAKLEKIRKAEAPFFEPRLKEYLAETTANGTLSVTDDASVQTIARGIGLDDRIGSRFLNAGLGWGGSCFEGQETVFALNVTVESFEGLFADSGEPFQGDTVQVAMPSDRYVLGFDFLSPMSHA
jgi:UDP-glucose 6-dehydrogenase